MSNYVKSTNFASKDSLATGNPLKIVKGTEIDTEFNNIATAVATKADLNSPTFIGTPVAPTASAGTNTTQLATTAFVKTAVDNYDAALTVSTAQIEDSAVTTAKIADSNVTTAKLADSNVTTAKIADSNVTTAKIADSNITTAKIADGNVTTAKLASGEQMNTTNVLNATAGASVGAVGTYAFLVRNSDASILTAGSTVAGSGLVYGSIVAVNSYNYNTAVDGRGVTSPSGTWRLMGEFPVASDGTKASLWLRIS